MPTNYPGALDAFGRPLPSTLRDDPTLNLSGRIDSAFDAIEALEAKLGIGASTPGATGAVLRRTATGASGWGAVAASDLGTGVGRAVTFTVAAANASALARSTADYLCDGTADQVEILAAMSALPAIGGTVRLSEGTFTLAAQLAFPKAGVTLEGLGAGATTLAAVASGGAPVNTALVVLGFTDCAIRGLGIDGNKANNAAATSMILLTLTSTRCLAERLLLQNSRGSGLVTSPASAHARVTDVVSTANDLVGLTARAVPGGAASVAGCLAYSNGAGGFSADDGPVSFEDCRAIANTGSGWVIAATDALLAGCLAVSNTSHGFSVTAVRAVLSGCAARSNSGAGVTVSAAVASISACQASANSLYGVQLATGATYGAVSGTAIYNNLLHGIYIVADECSAIGNVLVANGTSGATQSQIYVLGSNAHVAGNLVRKSGTVPDYGIQVAGGSNALIGLNDAYNGGNLGAYIDSGGTNTRRVARSQLAYVAGNVMNGVAMGAATWVTVGSAQTFRVDSATSRVRIVVRAAVMIGSTASLTNVHSQLLINGTTAYPLMGGRIVVIGEFYVVGGGSVVIDGLAGATNHTVAVQVQSNVAATGYCRGGGGEFLQIDVEELQR